jgi:hypothetical protein
MVEDQEPRIRNGIPAPWSSLAASAFYHGFTKCPKSPYKIRLYRNLLCNPTYENSATHRKTIINPSNATAIINNPILYLSQKSPNLAHKLILSSYKPKCFEFNYRKTIFFGVGYLQD